MSTIVRQKVEKVKNKKVEKVMKKDLKPSCTDYLMYVRNYILKLVTENQAYFSLT